jgi:2-oxo-4-hydroxy-4-carboxy-5-ureidoimidazoline decarboxylase
MKLEELNAAPPAEAGELLLTCCASADWARAVAAGRPYADTGALLDAGESATAALDAAGLAEALAGHARIGKPKTGTGTEAGWSRTEQSGVSGSPEEIRTRIAALTAEYEEHFGRIFLIRAAGRDAAEILDALRHRLANDEETEQAVVRGELAQINRLRLEKLVGDS